MEDGSKEQFRHVDQGVEEACAMLAGQKPLKADFYRAFSGMVKLQSSLARLDAASAE